MKDTVRRARKARPIEETEAFTDIELDAMKARAKEVKKAGKKGADGAADLRAAIAALPQPERGMAERLDALIMASAPNLVPRTWYGMPAWAKDGKVLCHFTSATKFKTRYATIGFSEEARLDDGKMWPTAFALVEMTAAEEKRIGELVKKAAS